MGETSCSNGATGARPSTYPALIRDLIALHVNVLVVGGAVAARAAQAQTATIPIVFTSVGDPVGAGLVTSLSRPGANVTGQSNAIAELSGKQLELLSLVRAFPRITAAPPSMSTRY